MPFEKIKAHFNLILVFCNTYKKLLAIFLILKRGKHRRNIVYAD